MELMHLTGSVLASCSFPKTECCWFHGVSLLEYISSEKEHVCRISPHKTEIQWILETYRVRFFLKLINVQQKPFWTQCRYINLFFHTKECTLVPNSELRPRDTRNLWLIISDVTNRNGKQLNKGIPEVTVVGCPNYAKLIINACKNHDYGWTLPFTASTSFRITGAEDAMFWGKFHVVDFAKSLYSWYRVLARRTPSRTPRGRKPAAGADVSIGAEDVTDGSVAQPSPSVSFADDKKSPGRVWTRNHSRNANAPSGNYSELIQEIMQLKKVSPTPQGWMLI